MRVRALSRLVIRGLGTAESLFASLPLSWSVRMRFAEILGVAVRWSLYRFPFLYEYTIAKNREFGMGKQEFGEMQSIYALQKVLQECDRQKIDIRLMKAAMLGAEHQRISDVDLPNYLGPKLLGTDRYRQLLHGLPEF